MTLGVLVVGGITRLTLSGLSIVEWNPVTGVLPPIGDEAWQRAFADYQQTPDYEWRSGMTLDDFRFIYFWEYLHRLLARTIGLVFLVPFVAFWAKGWFNPPMLRRALLLFGLGAAQGLMGWLMVASGLVDRPSVSHYRLAAHLSLAFLIFGFCVWLVRELSARPEVLPLERSARRTLRRSLLLLGTLLGLQIVWGAFVAGLRGGKFYPTFPRMGGEWVPRELLYLDPPIANFLANAITVQWTHRVLGTLLLVAALLVAVRVLRRVPDAVARRFAVAFAAGIALQYALGILTLVNLVPVSLGVMHQAFALVLFAVWLAWVHHVRDTRPLAAVSG
jgi:cytochrome c oxidase assembly protein subunit 15